jgi:hypothetical protein
MDMISFAVHFHQFRFKVRADLGKDASEHFDRLAVKDSFAVFGHKDQMHMEHENTMSAVPNIVDCGQPQTSFWAKAKSMQISDLANPLREHQRIKARTEGGMYIQSAAVVDNLTDADIVDSYITFPDCGTKEVNPLRLAFLICQATNSDHFVDLLDAEPKQRHAHKASVQI